MTHGDPLAMVSYGIGVLPMIKQSEAEFPDATQTWYTDNYSGLGTFTNVKVYLNFLK